MQTIGERLEEARKRKGISIREAAEATKIRGDYLQKFESNQFDLGLADLYVRGFLRSYSLFLRLPAEKIVNDFNALTAGGTSSRRTPSREVYGRMDLSVASADEADAGAPQAASSPGEPEPSSGRRPPASFTRGGGSMQQGPAIDPNLVVKAALWIVGIVIVALVVWGIKSMVGSGTPNSNTPSSAPQTVAKTPTFRLIAKGPVLVQIAKPKSPIAGTEDNDVPGVVIFQGTLMTGDQRDFEWTGELLIRSNKWEDLILLINGAPTAGDTGDKTRRLPAP